MLSFACVKLTKLQRQQIIRSLKANKNIVAVYLFGSQAKGGKPGRLSDVDLGIFLSPTYSQKKHTKFLLGLFDELHQILKMPHIDLVNLKNAPTLLRYRILFEGEQLFDKKPSLTQELIFRAMQDYEDFRPHLETQEYLILKKISSYVTA